MMITIFQQNATALTFRRAKPRKVYCITNACPVAIVKMMQLTYTIDDDECFNRIPRLNEDGSLSSSEKTLEQFRDDGGLACRT